jgi:drug/metabolite transporter (DMT)-like permease
MPPRIHEQICGNSNDDWYRNCAACCQGAGHFLVVSAFGFAEASPLASFNDTEMIVAVAMGWWFFGNFSDHWTFVGMAILIARAIYISLRERKLSRS